MGIKKEGMCGEVVIVVRIEFRVADEVTAVLVLELDDNVVGGLVLCGGGDNAGADSGARPGVSTCCHYSFSLRISFVSSTALPGPLSVDRNGGDRNKQRAGDVGKKDLADAPSTSNDMSVTIFEGLQRHWTLLLPTGRIGGGQVFHLGKQK